MPRTALVTGASGLLGRQVAREFERAEWKVVGTGLTRANPPSIIKLNLMSKVEIDNALDEIKPQVVVHCAAQRFPDKVDQDPGAAKALNIAASEALAHAASSRGIFLIYISTDYVFPGTQGEAPYDAEATPKPSNLYGETKLDGERAVLGTTNDTALAVVLRVPVLYGPATEPKESAVNVLMDSVWKAQSEKVVMDDWSIRYPTHTEDVGRVCKDIAETYLRASTASDRRQLPRRLQFTSEDRFTKYEMCELFADILGVPMARMEANKQGNDPAAAVQRPYDCHLSTQALKDIGISTYTQSFEGWWKRETNAYRR